MTAFKCYFICTDIWIVKLTLTKHKTLIVSNVKKNKFEQKYAHVTTLLPITLQINKFGT